MEAVELRLKRGVSEKDDKALAQLSGTPGWVVIRLVMQGAILSLLEPITPKEASRIGNLEMIGAMNIARGVAAKELRSVLMLVENATAHQGELDAKREADELESEEGEEM